MAGRRSQTNERLLEAFLRLGVDASWVGAGELPRTIAAGDTVLGRLDVRPTLDGVEPGLGALRRLARDGVDVLNGAGALLAAHDKLETAVRLARFGVAHPRTAHVGEGQLPSLRAPVVIKPRFGSWGWDVELCETQADVDQALRRLGRRAWFRRQGALVQEFVPTAGRDVRVIVAGGVVVGGVEREAPRGEWRTNVAVGARRRATAIAPEAADAALAAVAAIGADLAGVDLLRCPARGWVVLEVNGAVDFSDGYSLSTANVFDAAARQLLPAPREIRGGDWHTHVGCASSSSTTSPLFATP